MLLPKQGGATSPFLLVLKITNHYDNPMAVIIFDSLDLHQQNGLLRIKRPFLIEKLGPVQGRSPDVDSDVDIH
jgi:hypothetical protein